VRERRSGVFFPLFHIYRGFCAAQTMGTQHRAIPDLVEGRYLLVERANGGNMSTVYRAEDRLQGHRTVAVKLLNSSHAEVLNHELFRRELGALSRVEHPHIIDVLDSGWTEEHQCHYLVLEYLPRTLLQEIEAHRQETDQSWCWPLMRRVADALAHAHSEGVVHRDIKPSNILMAPGMQPKLADFGISWLRFELSKGVTVSSFWSLLYAAPEQRSQQQADERSDIYSLGCVFYHLLSRREPPKDGLSNQAINALQGVPTQIKRLLQRMLAPHPADRFQNIIQVCRQLDMTRNLELLPEVYLLITDRARRDLYNLGLIDQTTTEAACAYLLEELGDTTPRDVLCVQEHEDWRLYTEALRISCVQDKSLPMLVIKAVHAPYPPQLEQQKAAATSVRYLWQIIDTNGTKQLQPSLIPQLKQTLEQLHGRLSAHAAAQRAAKTRDRERRDFIKTWGSVLSYLKEQLDAVPQLLYDSLTSFDDESAVFSLKAPAPDDLPWPPNAPVVVYEPGKPTRPFFVGHVIMISGRTVEVSRDTGDINQPVEPVENLPREGILTVFQQEAAVSLERQRAALDLLQSGATVNPHLPEVLRDLSQATFHDPDPHITFIQSDLGEDKQRAVCQALAAQDLFVLQGPPGTGKTTTLAEIILQILRKKPDARILVASQSNVAVNHILSRIAEFQGDRPIEIVRVGRAEKIGHGAQTWTIDQRLSAWREQMLARTDEVLSVLKTQIKAQRRAHKERRLANQSLLDDLQQCQEWLDALEQRIERLPQLIGEEARHEQEDLWGTLALIHATLPEEVQGIALSSLHEEYQRLRQIVSHELDPAFPESRESRLLALVERWRKIFGKDMNFARPILERANILASTCLIAGGYYLRDQIFDWAIIDEAGRATTPELLVALVRARRIIIVGDERQLPPMLDEELNDSALVRLGASREQLTESLFASLAAQGKDEQLPAVQMLTMQHRMHPSIGNLVSSVFYDGKLVHAVHSEERDHGLPWLERAVVWFSTTKLPSFGETRQGKSYYNRAEIRVISMLLHRMERTYQAQDTHRKVAVITPYNAQIVELMAEIIPTSSFWQALTVEVATIDAYQGRDCDIVLYSTVRSNKEGQLGFLRDRRRLNVALSRAREALIIVGDLLTLERGKAGSEGNPYQELVRYLRTHSQDCLIDYVTEEELHG
jgi:serine/threonine protein kinase